jgi:hypothetical protein
LGQDRSRQPKIGVEIFEPKRELITVETLGATPILGALKLFDDQTKTLDLTVSMLDERGDVAHQTVQKGWVRRQIVEIKLHVRFYSDVLIRRIKFAMM